MLGTLARRGAVGGLATLVGLTVLAGPARATNTDPVPLGSAGTIATWGPGVSASIAPPNGIAPPTLSDADSNTAFQQVVTSGPTTALGLTAAGKVVLIGTPVFGMTLPGSLASTTVTQISADDQESGAAVTKDGTVIGWGPGGESAITDIPTDLSGVTSVQIDPSGAWGAAIKHDGTVVAWGANTYGQTNVPADLTGVTSLSLYSTGAYALKSDGTVVGLGTEANQTLPTALTDTGDNINVTSVADRGNGGLALLSNGTVVSWGQASTDYNAVPTALDGKTITTIAASSTQNLAVDSSGEIYTWGQTGVADPAFGQLPTGVDASRISSISLNSYFAAAVVGKVLPITKPGITGNPEVGQTLTATPATFSGDPDQVDGQWYAGGTPITNATQTTYVLTNSEAGKTITYRSTATRGSESATSESDPTAAVAPEAQSASTTKVIVTPASSTWGKVHRVTATVTAEGAPATGKVTIKAGSSTITATLNSSGIAIANLPARLRVGKYIVSAAYSGSTTAAASTGSATLLITKASVKLSETFPATIKKNKRVTAAVRARIIGSSITATGTVKIYLGKKVVGKARLVHGVAKIKLAKLPKGKQKLTIKLPGNVNVNTATMRFTIRVK